MKKHKFYKESDGRWYIDLPQWPGSKADLEMVAGADTMLEMVGDGESEVWLEMSDENFPGANTLKFVRMADELYNGAFYYIDSFDGKEIKMDVWLCDVTKFVFGGYFPNEIYFLAE